MTRKRAHVGNTHSPNQRLIQTYTIKYGWAKEALVAVLSAFGPLPKVGQDKLIRYLVPLSNYRSLTRSLTTNIQRKRLEAIEKTTKKLLQQLREPAVKFLLATAGLFTAARDEVVITAEFKKANDNLGEVVRALKDIHDRAQAAARAVDKRITPKCGGSRRRPTAKGQLIRDAMGIYSHMREQYPDSGKQIGFGGPMVRFVQAIGALFGVGLQEFEIHEVWRSRKSKQKEI